MSKKRLGLSLLLKDIVIIAAIVGTAISALASENAFMSGSTVFMFFTIQSNIAIALIALIGGTILFYGNKPGELWYVVKFAGTIAITLTGVVFCIVLAPTLGDKAWNLQNVLTHVVTPVFAIADFFVSGIDSDIRKRNVFWVIVPPILYAIYAGIGYLQGWEFAPGYNYPYFFLNWGSPAGAFGFSKEIPFMGVAWWILAIMIFLLMIGYLYLKILDGIKNAYKKKRGQL